MGKLYQLNLSNLVITHKHFGKMMNIEIFSNDFDKVIKSSVATGRTTYENAIHYLLPLINRFSHQRKIQTPEFYKRLSKDILDGCIMPPLTIAFITPEEFNLNSIDSEEVKSYCIKNIKEGYILDGIQRLNTLYNISEEPSFNGQRNIYLNIIFITVIF